MPEQRPDRQQPRKNGAGRPPTNNGGLRFGRGLFGWVLFIALAVMLFMLLSKSQAQYARVALSDFYSRLETDKVANFTIEGDRVLGEFREPEPVGERGERVGKFQTEFPTGSLQTYDGVRDLLAKRGNAKVKVENNQNVLLNIIVPLIPWLLIFGFIWFFVFRQLRNSAGAGGMLGNFGRSTAQDHLQGTHQRHLRRCGRH